MGWGSRAPQTPWSSWWRSRAAGAVSQQFEAQPGLPLFSKRLSGQRALTRSCAARGAPPSQRLRHCCRAHSCYLRWACLLAKSKTHTTSNTKAHWVLNGGASELLAALTLSPLEWGSLFAAGTVGQHISSLSVGRTSSRVCGSGGSSNPRRRQQQLRSCSPPPLRSAGAWLM